MCWSVYKIAFIDGSGLLPKYIFCCCQMQSGNSDHAHIEVCMVVITDHVDLDGMVPVVFPLQPWKQIIRSPGKKNMDVLMVRHLSGFDTIPCHATPRDA